MFDQFMGTTQAPQPQPQQSQQPQPKIVQPVPLAPPLPTATQSKSDPVKEIRKRCTKEFLGDKGDDPTVVEQWLSCACKLLKELKCMPVNNLLCVVSLLEGESYQWWETLISVTSEELVD